MDDAAKSDALRIIIECVRRYLAGDKAAFGGDCYEALYRRGEPLLWRYIACPNVRSDILQEAILGFWKRLEGGYDRRPEAAPDYYDTCVVNAWRDYWRRRCAKPPPASLETIGPDQLKDRDELCPLDECITREISKRIRECVGKLPSSLRGVVALRIEAQLTLRELARQLGTTVGKVRTPLGRGLTLVAICLANAGIDVSGDGGACHPR